MTLKANLHLSPSNNVILPGSASNDLLVYVGMPSQSVLFGVSNTQTLMKVDGTGNVAFSGNVSYCNQLNLSGIVLTQKQTTINTNLTSQVANIDGFTKISGNVSIIMDNGDKYIRFMQSGGNEYARLTSIDGAFTVYSSIKSSNSSSLTTMSPTGFTGDGANITNINAGNISTGTLPVTRGGTGTTSLTANKVLIGNATSAPLQPSSLHWDNINNRLGIGTTTPSSTLDVTGIVNTSSNLCIGGFPAIPIGTIWQYGGSTAPSGWLICNGDPVSRVTYVNLYTIISTTYGTGDGSTTFNVPDFRGRTGIGAGQGTGLTNRTLGSKIGEEAHTLITSEIPSHTHTGTTASSGSHTHVASTDTQGSHTHTPTHASGFTGGYGSGSFGLSGTSFNQYSSDTMNPAGAHTHTVTINADGVHTHSLTTDASGGGSAHNVIQPSIVINYIIKF